MQHGEAAPESVDASRPLTLKGKNDLLKVASFMRQARVRVDEVWYSPKLRAKQTAEIVAKEINLTKLIEQNWLKPNDPIDFALTEIQKKKAAVLITGHLPFIQKLASFLLSEAQDKELIKFVPGSVMFLEGGKFSWQVAWMINPEII